MITGFQKRSGVSAGWLAGVEVDEPLGPDEAITELARSLDRYRDSYGAR